MLFDTDVLIWVLRGNARAAAVIETANDRSVSVISYMEMLQGARDKKEVRQIKSFLFDTGVRMCSLTENIGHRAAIYMETYRLSSSMDMGDALIAATASESNATLCTGNVKHYRLVPELGIEKFRP